MLLNKFIKKMENEVFKKLKMLIEALTHSGRNILDEDIFKQIKTICKSSQNNVLFAYSSVLSELKKNNSQIRLAAFQLCKELFRRSTLFRENVVKDLNVIFDLTTEINSSKKLPPPKSSAETLKRLILTTLKEWVDEFGDTYKKLQVAYKYFEKCKQVDFETMEVRNAAEQLLENERQMHVRMISEAKVKKVLDEFHSNVSEIKGTITCLSNCISLLLPPAEEFFIPEHSLHKICTVNNDSDESTSHVDESTATVDENEENENYLWNNKSTLRECGISFNYNLSLKLNIEDKFKIEKTKENSMVIENAKDCEKLIKNRFLPLVKKWIKVHSVYGERNGSTIKEIIDLKEKLENILKKYNSLSIDEETCISTETDSDGDYEFEEVKKEGYEDSVDLPEELMLDCLKEEPGTRNLVRASTSKDAFKEESAAVLSTSSNSPTGQPDSNTLLRSLSDMGKQQPSKSPNLPFESNLSSRKGGNLSAANLIFAKTSSDEKCWDSTGYHHEIPHLNEMSPLRTEALTSLGAPKKSRKKRKLENKNLTHKKMKTSAAALKILESKNLPGLVDVVKKQNNAYARLSKKLFKRCKRGK